MEVIEATLGAGSRRRAKGKGKKEKELSRECWIPRARCNRCLKSRVGEFGKAGTGGEEKGTWKFGGNLVDGVSVASVSFLLFPPNRMIRVVGW